MNSQTISSKLVAKFLNTNKIVLIALIGLWCVFLWNAMGSDRSFAVYRDNEFMIGTVLASISHTLSSGDWPIRMNTILGGIPLYNQTQLSSFYPFYFASLPIYGSPLDVVHWMHWVTLLHILILEINMYLFLRIVGTSRLAALTGAAIVAFSANSFVYATWVNITAPYSWLPLYLGGLVGILKYPDSKIYSFIALLGITFLTLASPSQPLIHAVYLTIIFLFSYWRDQLSNQNTSSVRHATIRIVCVGILAIFVTAPVVLPATLEYKDMIRWVAQPYPPVYGNGRIPFGAFITDQLTIADLGGVFFKFKNAAVGGQFVGIFALSLAGIAVVSRHYSWLVKALAFISIYSLISSTGSNLGLAYLNYVLPMINKIREPSRFLVLFQISIGSLAAMGIDDLRKIVLTKDFIIHARKQLILLSLIAIISTITFFITRNLIVSKLPPLLIIFSFVALVLITIFFAHKEFQCRGTLVAVSWSSLTLILLAMEVPWYPPPVFLSQYLNSGALSLDIALERLTKIDPVHEYRVIFEGKIEKQQASMLASYRGVRTLNSFLCPAPRYHFEQLYYHGPRESDNYFRILGAKYMICEDCTEKQVHGYKYLESIAGYDIFETQDVLPRSFIAQSVDGEFKSLPDFTAKSKNMELTKKILFVEPNSAVGLKKDKIIENDCLSREDIRSNNYSRYLVQCKSAGVMVLNEFFDKAWKTKVDGINLPTLRVNGNQMGVPFKAGSHIIEFRYLPNIFLFSLFLMIIGLVATVLIYGRSIKNFIRLN